VESRPSMAIELDGFVPFPLPDRVAVRRVEHQTDLASVADLQVRIWHWSSAVARRFLPPPVLSDPGLAVYLGLLDGRAVATAAAHLDHGAVGIFGVGTVEEARQRGIGTAITGRAIADAMPEADLAWLQSTPLGRSMYERMGFRPSGDWLVWTR
jgi:GNAT superfamily N-acetyltransferase